VSYLIVLGYRALSKLATLMSCQAYFCEISPHAVSNCGVSLLKVGLPPAFDHTAIDINLQHATSQGQNEIYAFLLAQGADPYLYDHAGMYGNSSSIVLPGIC
jgi:hypothetical protein